MSASLGSDYLESSPQGRGRTMDGTPLTPGVNVDRVDVEAGTKMARQLGYAQDGNETFVVEYALWRHARGEEAGAMRSAQTGGIDITSWYVILAAAISSADARACWSDTVTALKEEVNGR